MNRVWTTSLILAAAVVLSSSASASEATTVYLFNEQADFNKIFPHYDLSDPSGPSDLRAALQTEITRADAEDKQIADAKNSGAKPPAFNNHSDKDVEKILGKMLKEADAFESSVGAERANRTALLVELGWSVSSGFMVPIPPLMNITRMAWELIFGGPFVSPPVCAGSATSQAANLDTNGIDPVLPSTFWNKPADVASKDLYYGFERTSLPRIEDQICEFVEKADASDSDGTHAKFTADCGPYKSVKIKFGKYSSEAFGSRLYWLMGYNVYPTDHADYIRIKFTPEIFTHFNDRKDNVIKIIPGLITEHTQYPWDPFQFMDRVEMKDGTVYSKTSTDGHSLDDLKKILFIQDKKVGGLAPALVAGNLTDVQSQIQYLVFGQADIRVQPDDKAEWKSVGSWDWTGQGHSDLRELRMSGIFLAWLDAFDARWDNNELLMSTKTNPAGPLELRHMIKDVGGVLGGFKNLKSVLNTRDNVVRVSAEDPNDFEWEFTKAVPFVNGRPTQVPLNGNFHTIQLAGAIADGNIDDALYMASFMKDIQPEQVKAALIGAGFPSAKVRMFMNKLANRRNLLFKDLGMTEVAQWPLEDQDQNFSYDPKGEIAPGAPESVIVNAQTIYADDNDGTLKNAYTWVVYKGKVMLRSDGRITVDWPRNELREARVFDIH